MHGKNSPGIRIIMKKDSKGSFTENALLCQDILKYRNYLKDHGPFKAWDLTKWLLENHQPFIDHYKIKYNIPKNNRIEHRLDRVKDRLEELAGLGLILRSKGKASTVDSQVDLYVYSEFGYLIAAFIESIIQRSRGNKSYDEIYRLLTSFSNESSSPSYIICSHFFKKCINRDVFAEILLAFGKVIGSNLCVRNVYEFLRLLIFNLSSLSRSQVSIVNLWNEAIRELKPHEKKLFFYQFKLHIGEKMVNQVHNLKEYQELNFKFRSAPETLVLEGLCENCKLYVPTTINIMKYMDTQGVLSKKKLAIKCPSCNASNSLVIPVAF